MRPARAAASGAFALLPRRGAGLLAVAAVTAVAIMPMTSHDDAGAESLGRLPWLPIAAITGVVMLGFLHYVLAAAALRAASGRKLPYRRTISTQLAAASANRVVPGGVAGAAVNARVLERSGASAVDAVMTVVGLGALGAVGDFLFGAGVVSFGPLLGLGGGPAEVALLTAHGVRAAHRSPWTLVLVAGLAIVVVAVVRARQPRRVRVHKPRASLRDAARGLAAHPRRLLLALPASTGTTAVLAVGFATCVRALGAHAPSTPSFGALLVLYLVAAAAGSAVPLPAFFGTTEAALVAGLVVSGVAAPTALTATLVFRLIAFWLPLPLGIFAARRLRLQRWL